MTTASRDEWDHWNDGTLEANVALVQEFRSTGGHPGGYFAGSPMLLLHHAGARTGAQRVTPLVYLTDHADLVVAASKGGAPQNPDRYHNLKAHPEAIIEVGDRTLAVTATEISGPERDHLYHRLAVLCPAFAGYERATPRVIPMFRLRADTNDEASRPGDGGRSGGTVDGKRSTSAPHCPLEEVM